MSQESIESAIRLGNKEFLKGFISGQLVLLLLLSFLIKVFLLRNGDETRAEQRRKPLPVKVPLAQINNQSLILSKLGYEPQHHLFESCDWLSIVLGTLLENYRRNDVFIKAILTRLDAALNADGKPDFLGPVSITEIAFGHEFIVLKNARVRLSDQKNLRFLIDFSFQDKVSISLDTQLVVNWPQVSVAALPISLSLSLVRFAGTLTVEWIDHHVRFSVLDDFVLDIATVSEMGHRTKVKDLPKLRSLLISRIRNAFMDSLVHPNVTLISLPTLS